MNQMITVITVSLNSADTIEKSIQSVIHQKYDDLEYIIIDGGSTDGTTDIIKKYDKHISFWVSEPDAGIYNAMNKGIRMATGDYVLFLNSDDWLEDGAIARVSDYIDKVDSDVYYGHVIRDDGHSRLDWIPESLDRLWWWMPFGHQGVFVRREILPFFDEKYRISADYNMMLDLYSEGRKFSYMPFVISYFGQNGISNSAKYKMRCEQVDISASHMIKYKGDSLVFAEKIVELYCNGEIEHQILDMGNYTHLSAFLAKVGLLNNRNIVFGSGLISKMIMEVLKKAGCWIDYIVDNDKSKWGTMCDGFEIASPERLRDEKECNVLVLTIKFNEVIATQLNGMNLSNTVHIFDYLEQKKAFEIEEREYVLKIGKGSSSAFRELCAMVER